MSGDRGRRQHPGPRCRASGRVGRAPVQSHSATSSKVQSTAGYRVGAPVGDVAVGDQGQRRGEHQRAAGSWSAARPGPAARRPSVKVRAVGIAVALDDAPATVGVERLGLHAEAGGRLGGGEPPGVAAGAVWPHLRVDHGSRLINVGIGVNVGGMDQQSSRRPRRPGAPTDAPARTSAS